MGNSADSEALILGIDGGGSKCHAVLYRDGREIGAGLAGPANPTYGYERATESIVAAATAAVEASGLDTSALQDIVAGVGLAGLNLQTQRERMQRWPHPFRRAHFATDLEVASLGAHDGQDGAVVISGTGSSGYCRVGSDSVIIGASGFPAADIGGGAWLGLQAIRAVLQQRDGIAPETSLSIFLDAHFAGDIAEQLPGMSNREYARLAPLVVAAADAGDDVADEILERGARYLGRMLRRLLEFGPPRIAMIGGLAPFMAKRVDDDLRARLVAPSGSPALGAVIYARKEERRLAPAPQAAVAQNQ